MGLSTYDQKRLETPEEANPNARDQEKEYADRPNPEWEAAFARLFGVNGKLTKARQEK